jgi:hypothetical protein
MGENLAVPFLKKERRGVNKRRSQFEVFLLTFANAKSCNTSKYTYLTLTFASSLAFAKISLHRGPKLQVFL